MPSATLESREQKTRLPAKLECKAWEQARETINSAIPKGDDDG